MVKETLHKCHLLTCVLMMAPEDSLICMFHDIFANVILFEIFPPVFLIIKKNCDEQHTYIFAHVHDKFLEV